MIIDEALLRRLDAFSLSLREAVRGSAGGLRRARTLGSSVEFSDFRRYVPGDDPRRVDWNAFARFDKLFLKLFLDEQETTLRILLDASKSMQYGEPNKWPLAQKLAAMLSYLSLTRYDRVVIVTLQGDDVRQSRTFSGRASFPQVEAALEAVTPRGETRLDAALQRVPITSGRGVAVLISDLLTDTGWTRGADSLLYRKQEVTVLQVLAPQETDPDLNGAMQLLDSEGGPSCDVQASPDTLKRYQQALQAFIGEQETYCSRRAIPYLTLRSDMSVEQDVLKSLLGAGVLTTR